MEKVCPFILRENTELQTELLVFQHPESGIQLVKGTLESNEAILDAALRELFEESGIIRSTEHCTYIGQHPIDALAWHFVAINIDGLILAEQWQYQTLDDYGHIFSFFWMPVPHLLSLDEEHIRPKYLDAIHYILKHR
ncbi:NUDIX domain-containing protein [Acinetobacter sp. ANC 3813]|uniref:NUDIX domain-containing protein n=1 Tax=Acinetobacter sp. ANC 3813 TaxID=1977873 RepID=UPI000A348815|nr:NUDIX domain-containing protein [Acinetobacter sp. ANC 3813]OTG89160.1 hypothetical protein B9T34_13245 [Acinetobacter sp. ANC 3813]